MQVNNNFARKRIESIFSGRFNFCERVLRFSFRREGSIEVRIGENIFFWRIYSLVSNYFARSEHDEIIFFVKDSVFVTE